MRPARLISVELPGGDLAINVPEDMTLLELLGHLQRANHPAADRLLKHLAAQRIEDKGSHLVA